MVFLNDVEQFQRSFSGEERMMIQTDIMWLEASNPEISKVNIWGKVIGREADYIILNAFAKKANLNDNYPSKIFFYRSTTDSKVRKLPEVFESEVGDYSFTGLPKSEINVETDEETKEDGSVVPGKAAFLEVDQLAFVVRQVDANTAVIPKGAFIEDQLYNVSENCLFSGLSASAAMRIDNYFHLRKPLDQAKVRDQDGNLKSVDFLDEISTTHPKGGWALRLDTSKTFVTLRSLQYPGYSFFHEIGTKRFGGLYIGDGKKNVDIAFML